MGFYSDQILPRATDVIMARKELGPIRARVAAELDGEVVEIGFGSALNIAYYPPAVSGICRRSWPSTRPTTTDDDPIAAATCARPSQITLSRTCPGSASSAGPFSADSSTSTSGLHRSPGPGPVAEFWNPTGLAAA